MADLLTHLLLAFALGTIASWRVDWLTHRWVVVGVGGAAIPDLVKVDIVLDADAVSAALGVPFSFEPLSTLGAYSSSPASSRWPSSATTGGGCTGSW